MRGRRTAPSLLVALTGLLLVTTSAAAAATWTQAGYDAARTGAIPYEGPRSNDTAFETQLPGTPWREIILDDGAAYVATIDHGSFGEDLDDAALWRIDLDTAEVQRLLEFPADSQPVQITPEFVLLSQWTGDTTVATGSRVGELVALSVPAGEELWRVRAQPALPFDMHVYGNSVVRSDTLYVGFYAFEHAWLEAPATGNTVSPGASPPFIGVAAVDLTTGEELWTWTRDDRWQHNEALGADLPDPEGGPERSIVIAGIAADDERVYPYLRLQDYASGLPGVMLRSEFEIWALDAGTGQDLWTRMDTEQTNLPGQGFSRLTGASPVVTETAVHIRLDAFEALNPARGNSIWTSEAGQSDQWELQGSTAMGARDGALVATTLETVYRLDTASGDIDWQVTEMEPGRFYNTNPIAIDTQTAYIPTIHQPDEFAGPGLEARDLATGELLWEWGHVPEIGLPGGQLTIPSSPAIGPGVWVAGAKDGRVTVLGETGASLGAPQVEVDPYPGVDEEVTLDLADAEPGVFGPPERYRVDWGDGTATAWQQSPRFTHAYSEPGDKEARLQTMNPQNQSASTFVTFHVGEEPPPELNFLQDAFARENQDLTFGVLGILVALTGGAVGVTHRNRKRSLLQKEIEALEAGYEGTKSNPGECEAFLDTRKARARSLMLDGNITEDQFHVIEKRVEELHRELRTQLIDSRFDFLPHGMVESIKKALADGKINVWERKALDALLEREEGLTETQKARVRAQLDQWLVGEKKRGSE